jgi:negative regulator of sigma E activity
MIGPDVSGAPAVGPGDSEERESLLSAMYDGELTVGECELVARRLARDPAQRVKWSRYSVVRAVVRGDHQVLASPRFAARLNAAIELEPVHSPAPSRASAAVAADAAARRVRWWRPLAGVGVAAGVATLAILLVRSQPGAPETAAPPIAMANGPSAAPAAAAPAASSDPPSYVVPAALARDRMAVVPAAQLANYVVAHSEFSSPLGRHTLLSALMAGESLGNPASAGAGPNAELADGSSLDEPAGAGRASR